MKLYKTEKGIKVPPPAQAVSNGMPSMAAATMAMLEKGESFLVKDTLDAMRAEKKMRDLNARQRKSDGRVFTARRTGGGVRIWRVK